MLQSFPLSLSLLSFSYYFYNLTAALMGLTHVYSKIEHHNEEQLLTNVGHRNVGVVSVIHDGQLFVRLVKRVGGDGSVTCRYFAVEVRAKNGIVLM